MEQMHNYTVVASHPLEADSHLNTNSEAGSPLRLRSRITFRVGLIVVIVGLVAGVIKASQWSSRKFMVKADPREMSTVGHCLCGEDTFVPTNTPTGWANCQVVLTIDNMCSRPLSDQNYARKFCCVKAGATTTTTTISHACLCGEDPFVPTNTPTGWANCQVVFTRDNICSQSLSKQNHAREFCCARDPAFTTTTEPVIAFTTTTEPVTAITTTASQADCGVMEVVTDESTIYADCANIKDGEECTAECNDNNYHGQPSVYKCQNGKYSISAGTDPPTCTPNAHLKMEWIVGISGVVLAFCGVVPLVICCHFHYGNFDEAEDDEETSETSEAEDDE